MTAPKSIGYYDLETRQFLSNSDLAALKRLREVGTTTCARFGDMLWGSNRAGNCSCPWARPAGKVLRRLERAGYATRVSHTEKNLWGPTSKRLPGLGPGEK